MLNPPWKMSIEIIPLASRQGLDQAFIARSSVGQDLRPGQRLGSGSLKKGVSSGEGHGKPSNTGV